MTNSYKKINLDRLKSTFEVSSKIGKTDGNGLTRLPLSDEDKVMRNIFIDWLKESGLSVRIDDLGNIYGRREGKSKHKGAVVMGSHLDTQPNGGRYDGVLGVLAALEVIRTLNDYQVETDRPIEIVNFTAEEGGRFGIPMVSSRAIVEDLSKDYVFSLKDKDGITFEQSLQEIGFEGETSNRLTNYEVEYYLEAHIEQSPFLEKNQKSVGIVQGIEGVTNYKVVINGQPSHAVFPSNLRKDPLIAASEMTLSINNLKQQFEGLDSYIGRFDVYPSKPTITAGKVEFTFGLKHFNEEKRKKAIETIKKNLIDIAENKNVEIRIEQFWEMTSTRFSEELIDLVKEGAKYYGYSHQNILSPAGHDARYMNEIVKTGMIFAPSVEGLSHCEEEFTSYEDIEKTTNVLLYILESLAR